MGSIASAKPHVVCIPFPAQGHVNPFMQLAKLLHSRGFHITFVNTEFNHSRLLRSKRPDAVKNTPGFHFETIPDRMPSSDPNATQNGPFLLYYTKKHCMKPLRDLIVKLNSMEDLPPVSCIISDGIMSFAIEVARELGIPEVQFWTASACGLLAYLQFEELVKRGIFPLKDERDVSNGYLETPLQWIQGMKHMRLRDMPRCVRSTDPDDMVFNRILEEAKDNLKSDGIIINTFYDLEHRVLDTISAISPDVFCIGPLSTLCKTVPKSETTRSSLWKENTDCLTWLDKQQPKSVIFVNYGSIVMMTQENFTEFAWGLANSGHTFLWVLRPDVVMGHPARLPEEFVKEIKNKGLIVSWCPQDKVLEHQSIGAFLTHSGWNSIMEGICGGVPMLSWPTLAEQYVNCRYTCTSWGMGMEVGNVVKREELAALVREMMEGVKGKELRNTTVEWKKKSEIAANRGGSAFRDFNLLVEYLLKLSSKGKFHK